MSIFFLSEFSCKDTTFRFVHFPFKSRGCYEANFGLYPTAQATNFPTQASERSTQANKFLAQATIQASI